jgi:hypothetical protein
MGTTPPEHPDLSPATARDRDTEDTEVVEAVDADLPTDIDPEAIVDEEAVEAEEAGPADEHD